MTRVGLLCTRIRKEEKALIAALSGVGVEVVPVNPLELPHFFGPDAGSDELFTDWPVLIDRCANRLTVASINPASQLFGRRTLNAGKAATGSRVDVALALNEAGLPRPGSAVIASEEAGMQALSHIGYPAMLFPLAPATSGLQLLDQDIAEAVLEHRVTLGHGGERVLLVQGGNPTQDVISTILVINGDVIAVRGMKSAQDESFALARRAAAAINADMCGVTLLRTSSGMQVWDIEPVPEMRDFEPLDGCDPIEAMANMVMATLDKSFRGDESDTYHARVSESTLRERSSDVVLSA